MLGLCPFHNPLMLRYPPTQMIARSYQHHCDLDESQYGTAVKQEDFRFYTYQEHHESR